MTAWNFRPNCFIAVYQDVALPSISSGTPVLAAIQAQMLRPLQSLTTAIPAPGLPTVVQNVAQQIARFVLPYVQARALLNIIPFDPAGGSFPTVLVVTQNLGAALGSIGYILTDYSPHQQGSTGAFLEPDVVFLNGVLTPITS